MTATVLVGDCREVLKTLPAHSVQCVISSPPFFGLRDYGTDEWEGGDPACDHKGTPGVSGASGRRGGREHVGPYDGEKAVAAAVPFRDVCGRCGARRIDRQIGLEKSPGEFVAALVQVFREVRRVLRDDGTVWLNLGDSYNNRTKVRTSSHQPALNGFTDDNWHERAARGGVRMSHSMGDGIKEKDLIGVPWLVAFALRADGWYLRSDIIWSKPSCMPESVTDRPTRSHEYVFMLSKQARYYFDQDAIREDASDGTHARRSDGAMTAGQVRRADPALSPSQFNGNSGFAEFRDSGGRNKRSVWTVPTTPFSSERLGLGETEHFAVFPPKLIEPCVLAGSAARACGVCGAPWRRVVERRAVPKSSTQPLNYRSAVDAATRNGTRPDWQPGFKGGHNGAVAVSTVGWEPSCEHDDDTGRSVILDPFAGSGTVGVVAGWHGRDFIGIELNPGYARMARERIALEGRPGGRPAHHDPARANGHPSLFDGMDVS